MKSFGKYISKHLVSFAAFIIALLLLNIAAFGWTFHGVMTKDYGEASPHYMLVEAAAASSLDGISGQAALKLKNNHIWAIFLGQEGKVMWSVDAPEGVQDHYTIQDAAVFSKGYIDDYPVFIWNTEDGLLVLGYPKDSYIKLTSNFFPIQAVKMIPVFFICMLAADLLLLFLAYYFSKRKIIRNTEPIIESIKTLSDGKPVSLSISGELSEVADSVNKASHILSRQNEARANWISGITHDIRTPLSMIMGYAGRIACENNASISIREQAEVIGWQSLKIKELMQDLNLVSQLEYEMQPLNKKPARLSRLLRSYAAELLNAGVPEAYSVELEITPASDIIMLECDARLISRAIGNLVQNSINHNPEGCDIRLLLDCNETSIFLTVADNGVGLSDEMLQELRAKPHYMESTDERLDLRHGLGLLLVRQIVEAHSGSIRIESAPGQGCKTILAFPVRNK